MAKAKTDKAFLARLKREVPEALEANVDFDAVVTHILRAPPDRMRVDSNRKRVRVTNPNRPTPTANRGTPESTARKPKRQSPNQ